jgi:hypothetical protein
MRTDRIAALIREPTELLVSLITAGWARPRHRSGVAPAIQRHARVGGVGSAQTVTRLTALMKKVRNFGQSHADELQHDHLLDRDDGGVVLMHLEVDEVGVGLDGADIVGTVDCKPC